MDRKTNYLWAFLMCLLAYAAIAEQLQDPTKPSAYLVEETFSDLESKANQISNAFINKKKPRKQKYKVNSIQLSDKNAWAIVNGRRVGVGEVVDGARVVSILHNMIVLKIGRQYKKFVLFNRHVNREFE